MSWWSRRRRIFWRNASQGSALAALMFGGIGLASGTGVLIALGVCFAVLTLTFGRRALP